MSYVTGVVAATVASAAVVILCSGSRHEKAATSVCCAFIALTALIPLRSVVADGAAAFWRDVEAAKSAGDERLVASCAKELEKRVSEALREKFPGADVDSVSIAYDDSDVSNVIVTGCEAIVHGADAEEAEEFVRELLLCDNVRIIDSGGENYEG